MIKVIILLCLCYIVHSHRLFVRDEIPEGWSRVSKAPADSIIKFRIALKQYNLPALEVLLDDYSLHHQHPLMNMQAIVLAKSDPFSPTYGMHSYHPKNVYFKVVHFSRDI